MTDTKVKAGTMFCLELDSQYLIFKLVYLEKIDGDYIMHLIPYEPLEVDTAMNSRNNPQKRIYKV